VSDILGSFPLLLRGAWVTVQLTLYGSALALVLAFVFGLTGTSRSAWVRAAGRIYVEFFRGTATLVLMYWFFYALPLIGARFAPMFAAVLALGLNVGAYGAEVVRGAVKAVPKAQYEATVALNMQPAQRLRRVLLPQAIALMLPPFGNLLIELMKGSAVVSLISIADLMLRAQQLRQSTGQTTSVFLVILVMYFVIAQVLQLLVRYLERRADIMLGRRPRPRSAASMDTLEAAK
jgi:polar amino acid transport system permease protein